MGGAFDCMPSSTPEGDDSYRRLPASLGVILKMRFSYGVDVGGTKIEFGLFAWQDMILEKRKSWVLPTQSIGGYTAFLEKLANITREADKMVLAEEEKTRPPIGIGFPGIVDQGSGKVRICANVSFLQGKNFRDDFRRVLGHSKRVIRLNNDANCFALSEAWNPALKDQKWGTILGLILGTGAGGGIIVRGNVCAGMNNVAGEFGHIRVPLDAFENLCEEYPEIARPRFKCGCHPQAYNCLDRLISGSGFSMLYTHFHQDERNLTAKDLCEMYASGEVTVTKFGDIFLEFLASCLSAIINFIDPSVIVFGGGFSNWDELYNELPVRLEKYVFSECRVPLIMKAKYGDAGGVRGAALLNISEGLEQGCNDVEKDLLLKL